MQTCWCGDLSHATKAHVCRPALYTTAQCPAQHLFPVPLAHTMSATHLRRTLEAFAGHITQQLLQLQQNMSTSCPRADGQPHLPTCAPSATKQQLCCLLHKSALCLKSHFSVTAYSSSSPTTATQLIAAYHQRRHSR